jgi:hypothetical protein
LVRSFRGSAGRVAQGVFDALDGRRRGVSSPTITPPSRRSWKPTSSRFSSSTGVPTAALRQPEECREDFARASAGRNQAVYCLPLALELRDGVLQSSARQREGRSGRRSGYLRRNHLVPVPAAIRLQSVCRITTALHVLSHPWPVHVVEFTFSGGFDSSSRQERSICSSPALFCWISTRGKFHLLRKFVVKISAYAV